MASALVLGGAGAVGRVAVRTLAARPEFDRVVVADLDRDRAASVVAAIDAPAVTARRVDVRDPDDLAAACAGVDVVVGCAGPFYELGRATLEAAIAAGVDYVDVNDDVDSTLEVLALDETARAAEVRAVIGCGSSPGVTNLLALLASRHLLDTTTSIDVYHAHGGEPVEGPGVVGHRLHCMEIPVPVHLDGVLRHVGFFADDGIALRERVDFPGLGDDILVYPYPHPEQVTLPRSIDVRRVTNKGTVLPEEYFALTRDVGALGLASRVPVRVGDADVVPHDFAIAFLLARREEILRTSGFGGQRGCLKVVVAGTRDGEPHTYAFSLSSRREALGEGTGIPVAIGAVLLARGRVPRAGVLPPEAAFDPLEFVAAAEEVLPPGEGGDEGYGGVVLERVHADGRAERVAL